MIVKIEQEKGWIYLDNVDEVDVFEVEKRQWEEDQTKECYATEYVLFSAESKILKVLRLLKKSQLLKRIVVDNNKVYLCNDEGKTVERLN